MASPKARSVKQARNLRRDMSLPEVLLWQELRKRPSGLKFRRQHPIAPYILDFYCAEAKLAIEIDGEVHNRGNRPERDLIRDTMLAGAGIRTLRISAKEVLRNVSSSIEYIVLQASDGLPLHQPEAGPPPHASHREDS